MYKHVAETFVTVAQAPTLAEHICLQVRQLCQSVVSKGANTVLSFEGGCAVILLTDVGLFFRVSAQDPVIFHGIRTLLEGSLSSFAKVSDDVIDWQADEDAFTRSPPATAPSSA